VGTFNFQLLSTYSVGIHKAAENISNYIRTF